MSGYHDFSWIGRRIINLERLILLIVHPFDFISFYLVNEKPFPTPYTFELVRIVLMPFSYGFYYLIWWSINKLKGLK